MSCDDAEADASTNGIGMIDDWVSEYLPRSPRRILDIGCGRPELMQCWLRRWPDCAMVGLDVDRPQLQKNASDSTLAGIRLVNASGEKLPFADGSFDTVLMIKSLHHVPLDSMLTVLHEAHRVLRDVGRLVVIEPVYAGSFNEVLRVFHDELRTRTAAIGALDTVTDDQLFRRTCREARTYRREFKSFDEFYARVMDVTHTDFRLDESKIAATKSAYCGFADPAGRAVLEGPLRLDVLQKASHQANG